MTQMRSALLATLAAVLSLLAAPAAARAQGMPSDSVLRGFQPSSEYMLVINGKPVPAAEIYQNDQIPAILILSSALPSPVMLTPRAGNVETVNLMKVAKQKDGTVDLFADAVLAPIGQFAMEGENVTFTTDGRKVSLNPKPALTGLRRGPALLDSLPEYLRTSRGYTPNAAAIATLKKANRPVTVHVVFGSWCPHCRQHVPLMLRVENAIANPNVKFEYYGIAKPPDGWKDPEVKRLGVKGIPTAIVYVNGVQAGRIEGEAFNTPEVALAKIVSAK
jgi:thiol-disulfide isomerase/thioredoxin